MISAVEDTKVLFVAVKGMTILWRLIHVQPAQDAGDWYRNCSASKPFLSCWTYMFLQRMSMVEGDEQEVSNRCY